MDNAEGTNDRVFDVSENDVSVLTRAVLDRLVEKGHSDVLLTVDRNIWGQIVIAVLDAGWRPKRDGGA